MFALLFFFVFSSLRAEAPDHLVVPGALTASIGQVSLVEDYLWVKYPYTNLTVIPTKLSMLVDQLSATLSELEKGRTYPDRITLLLADRLYFVKDTVRDALNNYNTLTTAQRSKRGLVDGIGQVAKMLFGTALDSDVKDLQKRYNNLVTAAKSTNKMVELNCKNIDRLNHNVHALLNYTEQLKSALSESFAKLNELHVFQEVSLLLAALETSVTSIVHTNEVVLRNVVDASRGKVTSALLPVKDLLHALTLARAKFSLLPIFAGDDVLHYYPLLSSFLVSDGLVVHVPFRSHKIYTVFHIEPFPFQVNTTILTLNLLPTLVLKEVDGAHYSVADPRDLLECKTEQIGLYFCPASLFAFAPLTDVNVCELSLIHKAASRSLSLCPYTQLAPAAYFHKSFMGSHYFFFPTSMYVSVKCLRGEYTTTVLGHFSIPKLCSLTSSKVATQAETLHQGFMPNIFKSIYHYNVPVSNISAINYVTNTVSQLTFNNFSELESAVHDSLPSYLQPHVHYPSFFLPVVITLVLLLVLFCLLRRLSVLYSFLKARVSLPETVPLQETGQDSNA